jgi:hypothetical protein
MISIAERKGAFACIFSWQQQWGFGKIILARITPARVTAKDDEARAGTGRPCIYTPNSWGETHFCPFADFSTLSFKFNEIS